MGGKVVVVLFFPFFLRLVILRIYHTTEALSKEKKKLTDGCHSTKPQKRIDIYIVVPSIMFYVLIKSIVSYIKTSDIYIYIYIRIANFSCRWMERKELIADCSKIYRKD